ncbi:MAG: UbiA family prenyltransferase [Isosphaeraceae bacterium]
MNARLTAYLQLVRLPNVLTAAADSLAGWLLAGGSLSELSGWLPIAGASMVLYASGMALNDLFDIEVDRGERPGRPLPSGRVSVRSAAWLGGLGLALGPELAMAGGGYAAAAVAVALALCILGYDAGLKRTPLGPVVMGACRGLNLLMGLAHAPRLGGPTAWCAAGAFGLFVTGITLISRNEARGGDRRGLIAGLIVEDVALLGLVGASLGRTRFPDPAVGTVGQLVAVLLAFPIIGIVVNRAGARAVVEPLPRSIQLAVKTGILSLVWLDVGLVAAVRGVGSAAAVAVLWLPAYFLGRWLYST